MPTYEYACKACGEHLEVVQSFKDNALTECPACGGPLRKVFGNIGMAFKGSGFYKTDSRSEAGKGATRPARPSPPRRGRAAKAEGSTSGPSRRAPKSGRLEVRRAPSLSPKRPCQQLLRAGRPAARSKVAAAS